MGINLGVLADAFCTKDPVLFINKEKCTPDNPFGGFQARVTVGVTQNYKDGSGKKPTKYIPVQFWRGTAAVAAMYLKKGSRLHAIGYIDEYTHDEGQVKNGKKQYVHENPFKVMPGGLILGSPTLTEMTSVVRQNLAVLQANGRIPQGVNITAEEILAMPKKPATPKAPDWNLINQTGKFGNSAVYYNGQGWANPAMTGQRPNAANTAPAGNLTPEQLQAEAKRLMDMAAGMQNNQTGGAANGMDPFAS